MSATDHLMPGPEGKTPRFYEVERGQKTDSYMTAVSGNPIAPPPLGKPKTYEPVSDEPDSASRARPDHDTIGLTEAELEPYRDSPFWKTLRWSLFILFWLLWLGMLIAAFLLVFLSPGCAVRERPNWWQTAVAYRVWVPSFQDSDGDGMGDAEGLISRLENLRKTGVQTVWPSPFLLTDDFSNAVRDYRAIDSKLGVNTVADKLIDKVHEKDMHIVIDLPVATTSVEHDWFIRSSAASLPANKNYSEYYRWSKKAVPGVSTAYKNLFYQHEIGNEKAALLNWQNTAVRESMFEVLSSWIDRGVDGFHLSGIEYLARKGDGSEPNWPAIDDILRDIKQHVDTYANESRKEGEEERKIALFVSREEAKEKDKRKLTETGIDTVLNYELARVESNSKICHWNEDSVSSCVHEILSDVLLYHNMHDKAWPQWEFGNPFVSRIATRVNSRAHAEMLLMVQLLLPGSNSFYYGDELGMRDLGNDSIVPPQRGAMQWSAEGGFSDSKTGVPTHTDTANINWERQYSEAQSPLKLFKKLAKLRQRDDTVMSGKTLMGRIVHGAFTMTRFLRPGNETEGNVYVAALNFGKAPVSLPLLDLPNAATGLRKSQIVAVTSNVEKYFPRENIDLSSKVLELDADQGIVFKYPA